MKEKNWQRCCIKSVGLCDRPMLFDYLSILILASSLYTRDNKNNLLVCCMFIVHTFSNRTDTEYRQYRTNSSTYLTEHLTVRVIQLIASLIDLLR